MPIRVQLTTGRLLGLISISVRGNILNAHLHFIS
jgi:hypothetical protein